jgi:Flp pilus assembly protein TadB
MAHHKGIKREFEVAFSKNAQPLWLRIVKYIPVAAIIYLLWGTRSLWIILVSLLLISLSIHFWYRYKTRGWTKSFGGWKYHD